MAEIGAAALAAGLPASLAVQTVEESVSSQLKTVDNLAVADNGKVFSHTGEEWPGL